MMKVLYFLLVTFFIIRAGSLTANDSIDIIFLGDTNFGESYQQAIEKNGGKNVLDVYGYDHGFEHVGPLLFDSNHIIANLETSLTDIKSSPHLGRKDYILWSDLENTPATLKKNNISIVALANNHTMDFGAAGLSQTLNALEKHNIDWIGAGPDIDRASAPFHIVPKSPGSSLRLIIYTCYEYNPHYDDVFHFYAKAGEAGVNPCNIEHIDKDIAKARAEFPNSFIVGFPHFLKNYVWKTTSQDTISRAFIDSGADIVIGHGAHMLQAIERYRDKWIVHGIGNFIFNSPGLYRQTKAPPFSFIAKLTITSVLSGKSALLRLYPIITYNLATNYQPKFISGELYEQLKHRFLQPIFDKFSLNDYVKYSNDKYGNHLLIDITSGIKPFYHPN